MYLLYIFITYIYFPFYLKLKPTSSQNLTFGVLISGLQLFLVMGGAVPGHRTLTALLRGFPPRQELDHWRSSTESGPGG